MLGSEKKSSIRIVKIVLLRLETGNLYKTQLNEGLW